MRAGTSARATPCATRSSGWVRSATTARSYRRARPEPTPARRPAPPRRRRSAASSGNNIATTPTDATHATPPETTAKRGVAADATAPDSTSPRRGPLATTRLNTDDMRPRMWSGVSVCEIVDAADGADAVGGAGDGEQDARPDDRRSARRRAIASPQTATAASTIRPSQRACSSQPVVSAATVAPAATEA